MFSVGEQVLVKRTGGSWDEAKVIAATNGYVIVEFKLGNTYRGEKNPYDPTTMGYKRIVADKFNTHLRKMKRYVKAEI